MLFNERLGRIAMRVVTGMAAAGALAVLASCGGGTYQQQAFVPARLLVFGDESSRLQGSQGLKYSINEVSNITGETDCTLNPIWTQTVANGYGLTFANCNPNGAFENNAIDNTTVNGTVADVVQKVAAFQGGDTFNGNDLVLIWVGMNDILNEYKANASPDETVLVQDMKDQGTQLANVVNSIANAGAKVVILTVPDMSYSPYAFAEAQRGDFDRAKLLSDMSTAFNVGMRSNILNDGSKIALVLVDDLVRNAVRSPGSFGLIANDNQTYGCLDSAPLPTCTNETLRNDPSTGQPAIQNFMWADATHLGSALQGQIGSQAYGRARSNPF
ncbi:SGNH/GDSL hydrolase family protein [Scleromatobacter humisilvae]|uniref:Esterase n=1 Tax=Scleromatobacter humisilvae TaxID=2897159 RepID=A0A9X1YGA3_9BURK|nr:SGNH/GDSL hydrolase family protein [Scleromatobacter humisilvae]MCK9685493.1 esterase [Scleromatobacter humisilvae]